MNFSGSLYLKDLGTDESSGRNVWELQDQNQGKEGTTPVGLRYELFPGHWIEVPVGFITDFASVPRSVRIPWLPKWVPGFPLWWIFSPTGNYNRAAVLHDYLYSIACDWCSRFLADAIFRDAMMRLMVPLWRRWAMWAAVRVGGRAAWKSNGMQRDRMVAAARKREAEADATEEDACRVVPPGRAEGSEEEPSQS